MKIEYKLHKSDQNKGESGKYQILEKDSLCDIWVCCGIYFTKKDAVNALKELSWIY